MFYLLPLMLERVGILIIVAFLLSRMTSFRQTLHHEDRLPAKLLLIVIFGVFGMISNYTGVEIHGGAIGSEIWQAGVQVDSALANTRIMGVAIGGLLGGPLVGLGAGLIAGLHRLTLGGYTAAACSISTILAGVVTGWIGRRFRRSDPGAPWRAVAIGILMECVQMGIILLIARPFDAAVQLVSVIALPMIVMNGFGTLMFMLIIQSILQEEERTRALQTNQVLHIADRTLPFFRQGLNPASCREAASVILEATDADAISITDREQVLTHVGAGSDHHVPLHSLATQLTRSVLEQGRMSVATSKEDIQCFHDGCSLQAAIVLPLQVRSGTVGTLKLYYTNPDRLDRVQREMAEGLGRLFSTQLELAEAEMQSRLLKDAEVKALQAQVHPHFLFNAINTISALCRTDPDKARELLIQLGVFFRSNLQGARQILIPLSQELRHVEAYLTLEKARFPDKFEMTFDIEPELADLEIPPFTLQPLVENAVRHAFHGLGPHHKGSVCIAASQKGHEVMIVTADNGKGIPAELLEQLGEQAVHSEDGTGTALHNIRKRIAEIYGSEGSFRIVSDADTPGTRVVITLPLHLAHRRELHA
ncbi:sensor histidine kinase [Paenibacillus favisporus]|uniref:sensor histidine kinase n=1 Tax=Paenibacillus favisporus TaxID=221028 RepID=UPI0013D72277|nr:sensor histidine kinase [Paenibacillus favisporus]